MANTYCLSYGEIDTIHNIWEEFKAKYTRSGLHDTDILVELFLNTVCADVYSTDSEREAVKNEIELYEQTLAEEAERNYFLTTVYHDMLFNRIKSYEVSNGWLRTTYTDGEAEEIEMKHD